MQAPSRQQRRKVLRDLEERGAKILAVGLPHPVTDDDAVSVVLLFREILADGDAADRASRLADAAESLLDRTSARQTRHLAVACRKGCAWCCHQRVICTAPEVFRVAGWLRENRGRSGIPGAEALGLTAQAEPDGTGLRPPCALLVADACGVHPVRPIPCRALISMSAEACRAAMTSPATAAAVPLVSATMDAAEVVRTLMLSAVQAAGLPDAGYDLTAALGLVLADPDAERRWLEGEDMLASLRANPRSEAARAMQGRLGARIGAITG